jgi:site-specific recombinase XerD
VRGMINDRTRQVYTRAWQSLTQFANSHSLPLHLPLSHDVLLSYIAFLDLGGYAPATIATHLSAISFVHKINNLTNPADSFVCHRILKRLLSNRKPDSRRPITPEMLTRICASLPHVSNSAYDCALFRCMFQIAFAAMLRIGEITSGNQSNHNIQLQNVSLSADTLSLTLLTFKHSIKPITLVLRAAQGNLLCPVQAARTYLDMRGDKHVYFFVHADGTPISKATFRKRLNDCLLYVGISSDSINTHSFRIGGATHLANCGYSDDEIRRLGRWRSNALASYIRFPAFKLGPSPQDVWASGVVGPKLCV